MKQKFIEWFTRNNNGCAPAMATDGSFEREKTQHMFEAYQAGMAEGEARCAALAAENAGIKNSIPKLKDIDYGNDNMDDVSLAEDIGFNDAVTLMSRWMTETPATDYFLAEMRAQGVEMAAKSEQFSTWVQQGLRSFAIGVRQGDDQ